MRKGVANSNMASEDVEIVFKTVAKLKCGNLEMTKCLQQIYDLEHEIQSFEAELQSRQGLSYDMSRHLEVEKASLYREKAKLKLLSKQIEWSQEFLAQRKLVLKNNEDNVVLLEGNVEKLLSLANCPRKEEDPNKPKEDSAKNSEGGLSPDEEDLLLRRFHEDLPGSSTWAEYPSLGPMPTKRFKFMFKPVG